MSTVNLCTRYVWWRHSRGFGVHSPWAYSLITEALRPHGVYHAYREIDTAFGSRAKLAKMVMRVLLWLRPCRIDSGGDADWELIARLSGSIGEGGAVMIVDNPDALIAPDIETIIFTCLNSPDGRRAWQQLIADSEAPAMAIDTHRSLGILSRRQGLPKQLIHLRTLLPSQ